MIEKEMLMIEKEMLIFLFQKFIIYMVIIGIIWFIIRTYGYKIGIIKPKKIK